MQVFEHQKIALKSCLESDCKLVIRIPGSGKTFIKLKLAEVFCANSKNKVLFLGPSNLLRQYIDVFTSNGFDGIGVYSGDSLPPARLIMSSFDMLRLYPTKILSINWDCVICDEFHRAKNLKTKTNKILRKLRKKSKRWYAFSGTPFQNSPYEFFELLSLVSNNDLNAELESCLLYKYPAKKSFFRILCEKLTGRKKRLNQGPILGVANFEKFRNITKNIVDFLPETRCLSECKMPSICEKIHEIELSQEELINYKVLLKAHKKLKEKDFFCDDLRDESIFGLFSRLSDLRQFLLSYDGEPSSKMMAIIDNLKIRWRDENARILVFSNFVDRGISVLHDALIKEGIPCLQYTGNISNKSRSEILFKFNSGISRIMLLSPVGFEGLDIPIATDIIVMDPHFNPERKKQLISRALRAFSGNKTVNISHYISTSHVLKKGTVDEAVIRISNRKDLVNSEIKKAML